ncbi:DUF1987 domain-containing protein [Halopseudomonas laoshanensis]|uniref:DUF1987 domain-containing protein n=1 Tax=Halopseudomonas laoshanensis TaxID=2268758 RepID=A0A7V7KWX1_9GAMM|nr:biofilm regulation phosphoprotein SiaC [Halopseudomonas laoshanensis]KAA0693885.1 DUF1987 domain-containing protein [Halopseudomonas laoshanensis]
MTDFSIPGTQSTPEIRSDWDAGLLYMQGDSYPENSFELFGQVLDWIEQYLRETGRPLTLELHLLYLNTSSIKALMDIFDQLEAAHGEGKSVQVNWRYDPRNERVAELAEEFKEDCTFPFDILSG